MFDITIIDSELNQFEHLACHAPSSDDAIAQATHFLRLQLGDIDIASITAEPSEFINHPGI